MVVAAAAADVAQVVQGSSNVQEGQPCRLGCSANSNLTLSTSMKHTRPQNLPLLILFQKSEVSIRTATWLTSAGWPEAL